MIINYESGLKNSYKLHVWNFQCIANKEMLTGNADADASYPDADPDAHKFFNTGYADSDADLCMRIMSLCCKETEF